MTTHTERPADTLRKIAERLLRCYSDKEIAIHAYDLERIAGSIERQDRWIDVRDAMPDDEVFVLALLDDGDSEVLCYHHDTKEWNFSILMTERPVTHWMPIPAAPGRTL